MLLVYLLGWMLLGWIVTWVTGITHIFSAYKKGYNSIEWWMNNKPVLVENNGSIFVINFIYGSMVWPIKLLQFREKFQYLYEQYGLRQDV